jgi:TPR repeat protein
MQNSSFTKQNISFETNQEDQHSHANDGGPDVQRVEQIGSVDFDRALPKIGFGADYKLSADQGNAEGQWRYGVCLLNGEGVEVDLRMAAHYFKLSADQGNAEGQWRYGACLLNGHGVGVDFRMAAHYFKLCADQGNAEGQWRYGDCLLNGRGVGVDFRMAAHYLKL